MHDRKLFDLDALVCTRGPNFPRSRLKSAADASRLREVEAQRSHWNRPQTGKSGGAAGDSNALAFGGQ